MSWKEKDSKDSSESRARKRRNIASRMLNQLSKLGIWAFRDGRGSVRLVGTNEAIKKLSEKDVQLFQEMQPELYELTEGRRLDGTLDSRLVVFPESVTFYAGDREETYTFPKGSMRVVREDLAERLVEHGGAMYHPGPRS